MIDSHCHLDFPVFADDIGNVIQQAQAIGIEKMIIPAVSANNWQAVYALSEQHPNVYAAYGLHPMFLNQHKQQHIVALESFLTNHPQAVAVGECGLDFFVTGLDQQRQRMFFIEQLKLANKFSLPLIIHARKSLDIILKYSRQYPRQEIGYSGLRGVIHCFSGSEQQAYQCIEQGFLLGFGGPITYPRATKLRRLVARLPLDRLLLETDAPDQPPTDYYAQRCEPKMLIDVATTMADLRDCDVSDIVSVTSYNARTLFGI